MKFERKRDIIEERNILRDKIAEKDQIISELQEKLRCERREIGVQCKGCVNLLSDKTEWFGNTIEKHMCKLDIKCKDRKESNL